MVSIVTNEGQKLLDAAYTKTLAHKAAKQHEDNLRVVFRKYPLKRTTGGNFIGGEVIALFPQVPGDMDCDTCLSYMHLGQHGAANYSAVIRSTIPATKRSYAPLLAELERIGYKLNVTAAAWGSDKRSRIKEIYR